MKLLIRRSQSENRGLFGGHKGMKFKLEAWARLTDAEQQLLARYTGVGATTLTVIQKLNDKTPLTHVTVDSLVAGQVFETGDVTTLMQAEQEIKEGCENFRALLDVMASFGGVEEYDFASQALDEVPAS